MEAFLSRKRRRVTAEVEQPTPEPCLIDVDDDEPTEVKLAILSSLHTEKSQEELLEVLLICEGSVKNAVNVLAGRRESSLSHPRKKSLATIGVQSSINFNSSKGNILNGSATINQSQNARSLTRKGKTLFLYRPQDIANHTPCTIIHNFLPSSMANAMIEELLPETNTYESATFRMFDNVVKSPHTACFYVDSVAERDRQRSEYLYNGSSIDDIRELLPVMRQVSSRVRDAVNSEIRTRIKDHYPHSKKLKYQSPRTWEPNAAFVNCYDGGAQSVGYHSDQLTYLGPRAVIGSLSLGVAREFRVRKIMAKEEQQEETANNNNNDEIGDAQGQISIHLPHNSLLVMHAECQEEWKHSIHPAKRIDPHPVAGNKRLNITYRWYRPEFAPKYTPNCRCGVPCVLKTVQRQKEHRGRYMLMCQTPGRAEGDGTGCGFFQWAEFTDDGVPLWLKKEDLERFSKLDEESRYAKDEFGVAESAKDADGDKDSKST